MYILEGDIIPGIKIGKFVIGSLKKRIMEYIGSEYEEIEVDGVSIITVDNAKMWFDNNNRLQQIGVSSGFENKYNTIGIGSTMEDVKRKFGSYYNEYDEYMINGVDGICFELGDLDELDYWDEKIAPIEWIFVYKV